MKKALLHIMLLLSLQSVHAMAQSPDSTIVITQDGDTVITYSYPVFDYGGINGELPPEDPPAPEVPVAPGIRRAADLLLRLDKDPKVPPIGGIHVGGIPFTEGRTPTGGKTITVPILMAANAPCPQIALCYNSQAGNGVAGYGWSLSGLSSIRCVVGNIHFDGEPSPVATDDGHFSLDGVRLISNTDNRMPQYQWITSTGFIYVKEKRVGGVLRGFEAARPDGSRMQYGWSDAGAAKLEYPLTSIVYRNGFRVSIEYIEEYNTFYPNKIRYGSVAGTYPCEIDFTYISRNDVTRAYCAGVEFRQAKLLRRIESKDGGQQLRLYNLSFDTTGSRSLLKNVYCFAGGDSFNQLVFGYGDNTHSEQFDNSSGTVILMNNEIAEPYVRRGRFVQEQASDGIIIMPEYAIPHGLLLANGQASYGSLVPSGQQILITPSIKSNQQSSLLTAGDGFQTIDAVDMDGDGVDEIVKVNLVGENTNTTKMQIDSYGYSSMGQLSLKKRSVLYLGGMVSMGSIHGPRWREYYYGDFRGDGRPMMLSIALKRTQFYEEDTSVFDLIDIYSGSLVSTSCPFNVSFRGDSIVFVMDTDGDSKMELCRMLSDRIEIYGLSDDATPVFVLKNTQSLSGDYHTNRMQLCDMNGDGLLDIMFLPNRGSVWTCFLNTGSGFEKEERVYPNLAVWGTKKVLLQDINYDGKSDYLRVNGSTIEVYLNHNGVLSSTPTSCIIASEDTILPGLNICDGIYASTPVSFEGNRMRSLNFKGDERFRNVLRYMRDSYENSRQYFYADMATGHDTYSPGNNIYSYPYYSTRFPLLLLDEEVSYMSAEPDTIVTAQRYYYTGAVAHKTGLGFCGFAENTVVDEKRWTEENTENDPTCMGVPVWNGVKLVGTSTWFRQKIYTYESRHGADGKWDPALVRIEDNDYLNNVATRHDLGVDAFGYTVCDTLSYPVELEEGRLWITNNDLLHIVSDSLYLAGLPVLSENIVYKGPSPGSVPSYIHNYEFEETTYNSSYYPSLVTRHRVFNRRVHTNFVYESVPVLSTRYTYDSYGHVTLEERKTRDSETWVSRSWQYSPDGRFLTAHTNELGLTETFSNYDRFGQPQSIFDHAGRRTGRVYDVTGRIVAETKPSGSMTTFSYAWEGTSGAYSVTESSSSAPSVKTVYDPLGRKSVVSTRRFDGQWQKVKYEYDSQGKLLRESMPFRSQASSWINYTYDDYGRVLSKTDANGVPTTWSYQGRAITTTKDGVTSTATVNHRGKTVSVSDPGGTISYEYDINDRPIRVFAPGNIETSFHYNLYGDRTEIVDPSAGMHTDTLRYAADGTSERISVNPDGTVTTHYDVYGRQTLVERSGAHSTTYTYNSSGLLTAVSSSNGTGKTYSYDDKDRLSTVIESGLEGVQFGRRYKYDGQGRVSSVTSFTEADTLARELFTYANGWQREVILSDSTIVWHLDAENDYGLPVRATTGTVERVYSFDSSGHPTRRKMGTIQDFEYLFDSQTGNLLLRTDAIRQKTEMFGYDSLNRLTSAGSQTFSYDSKGNILSKAGYGLMEYADTLHPYQATSLTPGSNYRPYSTYTSSFTSFGRPATSSEGSWHCSWDYGADNNRVRMVLRNGSTTRLKRHYLGGGYERDIKFGNVIERLYLGGDAYSAPMVYVRTNGGDWTLYNIGRDYLGSVTHVATPDGTLVAEYSYDPWGRRRKPDTWGYYTTFASEPELLTGRGFTGHEHLRNLGLINMNARLYDPCQGRFLSPDPYVQTPDFSQSFNRYTYALNNPLRYTDESGNFVVTTTMILVAGAVIGAGIGAYSGYKVGKEKGATGWNMAGYILGGGLIGGAAGLTSGYVGVITAPALAAAGYGGFVGGAVTGFVSGAAGGAINGFGMTMLSGGTFADAFFQMGIQAGKAGLAGALIGGVSQGISSWIKGEGFWMGDKSNIQVTKGNRYEIKEDNPAINAPGVQDSHRTYDLSIRSDEATITLYRGTTGSENSPGFLYMTDNAEYAASYIKNGGELVKVTLPKSTLDQMLYYGDLSINKGIHWVSSDISINASVYYEYEFSWFVKPFIVNMFLPY